MAFSKTVWTNITPTGPGIVINQHGPFPSYGLNWVDFSKNNPLLGYCCIDDIGLFRTTDGGNTWNVVGQLAGVPNFGTTSTYIDSPMCVAIDPANDNHVIVTEGVRGTTLGYWESSDGGVNWTIPAGFQAAAVTTGNGRDVTLLSIDPTDFTHQILSSHSAWSALGYANSGIMETFDCGQSWTLHPPESDWPNSTVGISFCYHPATGQGNAQTWLVMLDGVGTRRTTNSGTTWTTVSTTGPPHGGTYAYYAPDGTLYIGGVGGPQRSTDNGLTWTIPSTGVPFYYYYAVIGDGTRLWTQLSYTGDNGLGSDRPFIISPIADGTTWTDFSAQVFSDGPFRMYMNEQLGVLYAACWASGLWALQITDPPSTNVFYSGSLSVSIL